MATPRGKNRTSSANTAARESNPPGGLATVQSQPNIPISFDPHTGLYTTTPTITGTFEQVNRVLEYCHDPNTVPTTTAARRRVAETTRQKLIEAGRKGAQARARRKAKAMGVGQGQTT